MEKAEGQKRKRVLLLALPYQGHLNPMLQLGTLLHSKGFSITVIHTQFNPPNTSNHPDFEFLSIPVSQAPKLEDFAVAMLSVNKDCEDPTRELLGQIMKKQQHSSEIACIIYDAYMYYADALASHFKLPSIILRPTSAANVLSYIIYPKLQEQGHLPLPKSMLQDPIPGLNPLLYKDLPISRLENVKTYFQLMSNVHTIKSSSAIIWNTMECLEQSELSRLQQQYQLPIFSIGPLQDMAKVTFSSLIKEDTSCIEWLDKQAKNSVLYVSIGSVATINEKDLVEMAWGLANSKQYFLWVIRSGSVAGSEGTELLPKGFREAVGEKGFVVKWAPQRKVLAHSAVGGFWSHCGWNSSLETLSEGVPVICKPFFGDQMINARYFSHAWKVGLQLENGFERKEIERVVRTIRPGCGFHRQRRLFRNGDDEKSVTHRSVQIIDQRIVRHPEAGKKLAAGAANLEHSAVAFDLDRYLVSVQSRKITFHYIRCCCFLPVDSAGNSATAEQFWVKI